MARSPKRTSVVVAMTALFLTQFTSAYAQPAAGPSGFTATGIDGKTEVDRTIGKCIAVVAGGAIIGALIGGRRNAARGAAYGAGAGVGVCAIMMSVASAQDRERLRQLQLQSLNSGQAQSQEWRTNDGHEASATVTTSDVVQVTASKSNEVLNCRRINTKIDAQGQRSSTSDVVCLHGDKWVTLEQLKDIGVKPGDVTV